MSRRVAVLAASAALISGVATQAAAADPASCASLASLHLPDTTITLAAPVTDGPLPPYCRVVGVIRPTADSQIGFESWLPLQSWNGKFNGVGGGGFAGAISTDAMSRALLRGYATASTDTGHVGVGPFPGLPAPSLDGTWALGHPEKVIDFGPRSLHLTTQNAKAIVHAFYGRGASRSYYVGCSTGGRQGLMEAQQFPHDYEGLVVGAPANFWNHRLAGLGDGCRAGIFADRHLFDAVLQVLRVPEPGLRPAHVRLRRRSGFQRGERRALHQRHQPGPAAAAAPRREDPPVPRVERSGDQRAEQRQLLRERGVVLYRAARHAARGARGSAGVLPAVHGARHA